MGEIARRRILLTGAFAGASAVAMNASTGLAAAATTTTTTPPDWINVKDHNATGDGSTDDTAAIHAAISAAPAGGGVVYFPTGTYKLTSAVTVKSGLTFRGDGPMASFVVQSSTTDHGFAGTDLLFVEFDGISIDGPGSGSGMGVYFTITANPATQYVAMRDCMVKNWGSDGVNITVPMVSNFQGVIAQTNGGCGFNINADSDSGPAGTSCQFSSCYANANSTGGYRLRNMAYSQLSGCAADSNPVGYELYQSSGISLDGCGAESNTTGVVVNGGSAVSLNALYFYGSKGACVQIADGAKAVSISGLIEIEPASSASACVTTDATSFAILSGISNVAPNSFAGPCQLLSDTAGALNVNGAVTLQSTLTAAGAVTLNGGLTVQGYSYPGGSVEAARHLIADAGNVAINGVGYGLTIKEGTNATMGVATLSGGTVTVGTTAVNAVSRIMLTGQDSSGTPGQLYVSSRTPGSSFVISSTSSTDTRQVAWILVQPS